jgi:hypothetical protein
MLREFRAVNTVFRASLIDGRGSGGPSLRQPGPITVRKEYDAYQ